MQPVTPAQKLRLFGRRGQSPPASALDPNWWKRFQFAGNNPDVVYDFENGLYWDSTSNTTSTTPPTLGGSPTITPGSGLLCNANNIITSSGPFLNAMQGGEYTLQIRTQGASNSPGAATGIVVTSNGDLPFFEQPGHTLACYNVGAGSTLDTFQTNDFTKPVWGAFSTSTLNTSRTISSAGLDGFGSAVKNTDTNSLPNNPTSWQLGFWSTTGTLFNGYIAQISAMKKANVNKLITPAAFTGTNGWWWNGDATACIDYGHVLTYEYTQPWTVIAAIYATGGGVGGSHIAVDWLIFCNAADPSFNSGFPCYELWVDAAGVLHGRLIHSFSGNQYIGKYGSTVLVDGKWHVVAMSYDGSGLAAGVKLYVDGVLETMTVESDTLGGLSIIDPGGHNDYMIGNQANSPRTGALNGALGLFRQYNVVKSQAFIAQFKINRLIPAIDPSCVLAPKLNEGGANTTTGDLSASGLIGTLSSSSVWLRG